MASFAPERTASKGDTSNFLTQAFFNPALPVQKEIEELLPGDLLMVIGFVPHKSKEFVITMKAVPANLDLLTLTNFPQVVPLCVKIRPSSHVVKLCGQVGDDHFQSEKFKMKELKTDRPFMCCVLICKEEFKVGLNNCHVGSYKNRCLTSRINSITIDGETFVRCIRVQTGIRSKQATHHKRRLTATINLIHLEVPHKPIAVSGNASLAYMQHISEVWFFKMDQHEYHLKVPLQRKIRGGLQLGNAVYICGKPNRYGSNFTVCIRESEHPLNVTMDLTVHLEEMEFICNRRYNGVEGAEPIVLNNLYEIAFQRKTHFDMLIVCDKLDFKVLLNNVHLLSYKYKCKRPENVNLLEIKGDVKIHSLCIDVPDFDAFDEDEFDV